MNDSQDQIPAWLIWLTTALGALGTWITTKGIDLWRGVKKVSDAEWRRRRKEHREDKDDVWERQAELFATVQAELRECRERIDQLQEALTQSRIAEARCQSSLAIITARLDKLEQRGPA